jgi:hypothetical protein
LLPEKQASSLKQTDFRDMFKKAYKSICTPTIMAHPDTLSPTPTTSSVIKTSENRTLMTLNQQVKVISKWNTTLLSCTAQAQK